MTGVGEFAAVNAATGEVKWKKKLGPEQRQSSPFVADGKVYKYTALSPVKTSVMRRNLFTVLQTRLRRPCDFPLERGSDS